jgi:hypothetical protein
LAAGLVVVPMIVAYLSLTGSTSDLWLVAAAGFSGILAALILASYVPSRGSGRLIEVGCSPCAVVAALAILGSFLVRNDTPFDSGRAWVAVALLVFGLVQRLADNQACSLPSRP